MTKKQKQTVQRYKEQKGKCMYCGIELEIDYMELDHIVPDSRGGSDEIDNKQILCRPCNQRKGDFKDSEYWEFLSRSGLLKRTSKPPTKLIPQKRFNEAWKYSEKEIKSRRKTLGIRSKKRDEFDVLNIFRF